jgi:hypothetical protein
VSEVPAAFMDASKTLPYPNPNSSIKKPVGSGNKVPGGPSKFQGTQHDQRRSWRRVFTDPHLVWPTEEAALRRATTERGGPLPSVVRGGHAAG